MVVADPRGPSPTKAEFRVNDPESVDNSDIAATSAPLRLSKRAAAQAPDILAGRNRLNLYPKIYFQLSPDQRK
jgi:hypothetical protein